MDGILYYSCRTNKIEDVAINIALYAKYPNNRFDKSVERAEICEHMKIGDSYNYSHFKQFVEVWDIKVADAEKMLWVHDVDLNPVVWIQNKSVKYSDMFFYQFDACLLSIWKESHPDDFKDMEGWE